MTITDPTETVADGRKVFIERPPTMTHVGNEVESRLHDNMRQYRESANVDIRVLLTHYTVSDIALRVVGVGSVGENPSGAVASAALIETSSIGHQVTLLSGALD